MLQEKYWIRQLFDPTAPTTPAKIAAAKDTLKKLIQTYHVTLISVGNGTASRESEQIIVELLKEIPEKVQYVIVNEAGAFCLFCK